jgi:hypothetical protein
MLPSILMVLMALVRRLSANPRPRAHIRNYFCYLERDNMKRAVFTLLILLTGVVQFASAQEHGQVGAFMDYMHFGPDKG